MNSSKKYCIKNYETNEQHISFRHKTDLQIFNNIIKKIKLLSLKMNLTDLGVDKFWKNVKIHTNTVIKLALIVKHDL